MVLVDGGASSHIGITAPPRGAWTGILKWATQLLSWAAILIIAQILSPAVCELVGLATLYVGLMQLVAEEHSTVGTPLTVDGVLAERRLPVSSSVG